MTLTGVTLFNLFLYSALQFTTATNASVLEAVIPVATALMSAVFLKERLHAIQWLGIFLSLMGAVWVVMDGRFFQIISMDWNKGDAIMVGGIICWAVYSITVKQYMHLFPSHGALLVMSGISVLVLMPVVLIEWYLVDFSITLLLEMPGLIAGLLYLGIFPSFIALLLYNRVVGLLGASRASVFLNFLPVITMTGAYFWLGEAISSMQILGALLVIVGVTLTTQIKGKS